MGRHTVLIIDNDRLDELEREPELGEKLRTALSMGDPQRQLDIDRLGEAIRFAASVSEGSAAVIDWNGRRAAVRCRD